MAETVRVGLVFGDNSVCNVLLMVREWKSWLLGDDVFNNTQTGPDTWQRSYPTCNGLRQSPINIRKELVTFTPDLKPFTFVGFDGSVPALYTLQNIHHTLRLKIDGGLRMYAVGGGLDGWFVPAEMHFHWGSSNGYGSEHAINSIKFPLESHLLMYNYKYGNQSNAMMYKDGLAILATFYVLEGRNEAFAPIEDSISLVSLPDKIIDLKNVNVAGLLPHDTKGYFRYFGSLTTPPCQESVSWTVFDVAQTISHAQLASLRKLRDNRLYPPLPGELGSMLSGQTLLMDNFRPLQPDNGRPILTNIVKLSPNLPLGAPLYDTVLGIGKTMTLGKIFKKKREAVPQNATAESGF